MEITQPNQSCSHIIRKRLFGSSQFIVNLTKEFQRSKSDDYIVMKDIENRYCLLTAISSSRHWRKHCTMVSRVARRSKQLRGQTVAERIGVERIGVASCTLTFRMNLATIKSYAEATEDG
jgi:hypothetical protein